MEVVAGGERLAWIAADHADLTHRAGAICQAIYGPGDRSVGAAKDLGRQGDTMIGGDGSGGRRKSDTDARLDSHRGLRFF